MPAQKTPSVLLRVRLWKIVITYIIGELGPKVNRWTDIGCAQGFAMV